MKWMTLFLTYFPVVLKGAVAVEAAIGSQPGAAKKEVLLNSITAAAKVGEAVDEDHVKVISTLIDTTVAALNTSGVFVKKG